MQFVSGMTMSKEQAIKCILYTKVVAFFYNDV